MDKVREQFERWADSEGILMPSNILWQAYREGYRASGTRQNAEELRAGGAEGDNKAAAEADAEVVIEQMKEALEAITELYNTDEGCTSLPEYINARAALKAAKGLL